MTHMNELAAPLAPDPKLTPFTLLLAKRIRGRLAEEGKTQAELGTYLGIGQQAVSKKLRGVTEISANELGLIAGFLGLTVVDLIGEYAGYPTKGTWTRGGNTSASSPRLRIIRGWGERTRALDLPRLRLLPQAS